jgi:hypothetical protein
MQVRQNPNLRASFWQVTSTEPEAGFISKTTSRQLSPIAIVAGVMNGKRLQDVKLLQLPDEFTSDEIISLASPMVQYDVEIPVPNGVANIFSTIGARLIALNNQGQLQPPLSDTDRLAIQFLNETVDGPSERGMTAHTI